MYKGNKLPVCNECWTEIAESDLEWGEEEKKEEEDENESRQ